jgi:hypothetical protein
LIGGFSIRLVDFQSDWWIFNPTGGFSIRLVDFQSDWWIFNPLNESIAQFNGQIPQINDQMTK